MSDFANYVVSYLGRAIPVAVFALAMGALGLYYARKRHRRRHGAEVPFPWRKAILTLMLVGYLAVVMFVTVQRGGFYSGGANFHLFRAWREAWNSFSERSWLNVLLNIGLFVPLGILLPLVWEKARKWYRMLGCGLLATLFIEVVQYLKGAGIFDVDDLFTNTLGAMMGFWLIMVILSARGREFRRSLCHGLALAAAAAAVGGVFAAYELQEYGNLTMAPAFRVDTSEVAWSVSCDLSGTEDSVAIYKTQPMSREACEAFGRSFFENLGIHEVDVTIYNEEVYLREHLGNRIMEVFYQDGHYSYCDLSSIFYEEAVPAQVDEETLRVKLLDYGIEIPETAAFSYEGEGLHSFRLDRYVDGDRMLDGAVTCTYDEQTGIREIVNELVSFEYYGEVEIISPQDAVEQVRSGWITEGEWFERLSPEAVQILSCDLIYQVDTKGFYQPVYAIELLTESDGRINAYIPAIK